MLPTPSTSHVPYDFIYEPAEDTFVFLDTLSSATETAWLHSHLSRSPSQVPLLVEIGPGSGVIIAFLTAHAKTIFGTDVLSLSVDVNGHACRAARTTVEKAVQGQRNAVEANAPTGSGCGNWSTYLSSLQGDLTTPLRPGTVDLLIFNPPYVPTENVPTGPSPPSSATPTMPTFEESSSLLELAYAGGIDGMEVTNRLLKQLPEVLSGRGVAYVLFCKGNKPEDVKQWIRGWGQGCADGKGRLRWQAETVGSSGKTAGWEKLEIVRIWRAQE